MSKGTHIILDCYEVPAVLCLDDKLLLETAVRAAVTGGATVINTMRYRFGHDSPAGCAVIVMLDESHISIHTYAEQGKMAIDIFTCGNTDAQAVADRLRADLKLEKFEQQSLERFQAQPAEKFSPTGI